MWDASAVNVPPNAVAAAIPSSPYVGDEVTLDGSNSNDPDNGPLPLSYCWGPTVRSLAPSVLHQVSFVC